MRNFRCATIILFSLLLSLNSCSKSSTAQDSLPATPAATSSTTADISGARVLVFSKTKGWRHDSIPAGIAALQKMASENNFSVTATEDASLFTDAQLSTYNAIVFLNTTLDVLDNDQQVAMERFIQAGGGFVGIHAAADTEWEGDWFWYRKLVGAVFKDHPNEPSNVQMARVNVVDKNHAATQSLPESYKVADEWYNYRDFYEFNKVLMTVDEQTYQGGGHGIYHPITWYHDFDGGRSFYTGLGHTIEEYSNPEFLNILLGGLKYAVGGKPKLNYAKSEPEPNRFMKKILVDHLDEPVQLNFFANGDALIAERGGKVKLVDYKTGEMREVGKIEVDPHGNLEFGLLGFAIDPNFEKNHNIYATLNAATADGKTTERLSRFKWVDGKLDVNSQEVLWEYHEDQNCCHTGGDLKFGNNGELFVSTGDNSVPFTEEGSAPIDFRPEEARSDSLRSAGNTQDMRGKILRIIPRESGGYDIPKGNLFADPKDGRPEIYVMGARNPYKIAYDKPSSTLFYGDVGPDAGEDTLLRGPKGYDEINRVTKAGNFGWPLFVGNNYAYRNYDFATGKSDKYFNPLAPENNSPRNTGLKLLPPAQPPLIWYPYGVSPIFPELAKGGRMALVTGVYHAEDYPASPHRYPAYYNNKLFILDFMRNWVKAVSFDNDNRIIKIEPFAPQINYVSPIDARFAPDGTLYILEYGKAWFKGNPEASLSRIEYVGDGNRPPQAKILLPQPQGAAPYSAVADASGSRDLDGDVLSYAWSLKSKDGKVAALGNQATQALAVAEPGEYTLRLDVKDPAGATDFVEMPMQIGNEPAQIKIKLEGNQSFYWPTTKTIHYSVAINDKEDGEVITDLTNVAIEFGVKVDSEAAHLGHQAADIATAAKGLMAANGCTGCHNLDVKVVGPAFKDVAARYKNDKNALSYLMNKINKGGNGAWGETNMPSFAALSDDDRRTLATYVLSLADVKKTLPLQGTLAFAPDAQAQKEFESGSEPQDVPAQKYELAATYTDKGAGPIGPIKVKQSLILVPARLLFEKIVNLATTDKVVEQGHVNQFDTIKVPATGKAVVIPIGTWDLTGISSLRIGSWITEDQASWQLEVRVGSATGELIADSTTDKFNNYSRTNLKVTKTSGMQSLYLIATTKEKSKSELHLYDISFHQ